jgi:hypothetical protein
MAQERELELNRETVTFIIDKAREFQTNEAMTVQDDDLSPGDDWESQTQATPNGDPGRAELQATVDDLEPDQQVMLVALMWLGRGDYDLGEWDDALASASDSWNKRTADYLIGTPMLADYLAEGLAQFA